MSMYNPSNTGHICAVGGIHAAAAAVITPVIATATAWTTPLPSPLLTELRPETACAYAWLKRTTYALSPAFARQTYGYGPFPFASSVCVKGPVQVLKVGR